MPTMIRSLGHHTGNAWKVATVGGLFTCAFLATWFYQSGVFSSVPYPNPDTISTPQQTMPLASTISAGIATPLIDNQWGRSAQHSIMQHQYRIRPVVDNDHATTPTANRHWVASNARQQLRLLFHPERLLIAPLRVAPDATDSWEIGMRLISAGSENTKQTPAKPTVSINNNRIHFDRDSFTEWYTNTPRGIEQGYTIKKPFMPADNSGTHANTNISLRIQLTGVQAVETDPQGNYLITPTASQQKIMYGQLHAFDAANRSLPTRMTIKDNIITLTVAARDATFPLTIDPLIGTTSGSCSDANVWCDGITVENSDYGYPVEGIGDVNGDGYDDVAIADPFYNFTGANNSEGAVYVFHGSANGLSHNISWSQTGGAANAEFGFSVGAADVNGDGFNDLIVGAGGHPATSGATTYYRTGKAYVYYGSSTGLSTTPSWTATPDKFESEFGRAVAGAGDVNGDGFEDVIIGAPRYSGDNAGTPIAGAGAAFVYLGSASGLAVPALPDWFVVGSQIDAELGTAVAGAGNVNGDINSVRSLPLDDIIIGITFFNTRDPVTSVLHPNGGRVIAYYGAATGLTTVPDPNNEFTNKPDWDYLSYADYANFGISLASAGNVNGDVSLTTGLPIADIIIGANSFNSVNPGSAYVFHGTDINGLENSPAWTVIGEQGDSQFAHTVDSAGDINGDGYSDVIVGDPFFANVSLDEGKAYVYLGPLTSNKTIADWSEVGATTWETYGYWVTGSGDVNGDGYDDIMIGAPGGRSYASDPTLELGLAYLYKGAGDSDLGVAMVSGTQIANSPVTVLVTVNNLGPDIAHKVALEHSWSIPLVSAVISKSPAGWNCAVDISAQKLSCPATGDNSTNFSLPSGASASVTVQLTSGTVPFTHTASVFSPSIIDPNSGNNTVNSGSLNSPPKAGPIAISTNEDTAILNQPFGASDPDAGATLNYVIQTEPSKGIVQINAGTDTFNYTPLLNVNGTDSFIFEVFDQYGAGSGPQTASIDIIPVNDAPVAQTALQFSVVVGASVNGNLTAQDVDSANLVYSIAPGLGPSNGNVTVTDSANGAFTYTPSITSAGTDQFTFEVADNVDPLLALTDRAVVNITITADNSNTPPSVTPNQSLSVAEDTPTNGVIQASDIETPNGLIFSLLGSSTDMGLGTVTISNPATGEFLYTPNTNVNGADSFSFQVTDTSATPLMTTGSMSITITPVNDPPSAGALNFTVNEDSVANAPVSLPGSDVDANDTLTYSIGTGATGPSKGTATLANNNTAIIYTPDPNANGSDVFQYSVQDAAGLNASAQISVTITPINDPPVLPAPPPGGTLTLDEDGSLLVTLTATDIDSNRLNFTLDALPNSAVPVNNIVLTPQADNKSALFTYTPLANFNGTDTLSYSVSDNAQPTAATVSGTLQFTVRAVNDIPVAEDTNTDSSGNPLSIAEDATTPLVIPLRATDIDQAVGLNNNPGSEVLSFAINDANPNTAADTAKGHVTFPAGTGGNSNDILYLPKANATGTDTFNFTVLDSAGLSSTATVSVVITAINDAPVIAIPAIMKFNVFTGRANSIDIHQFVSDIDSSSFNYTLPNGPNTTNNGVVSITDAALGVYSYTPAAGYTGSDSFAVQVADDLGLASAIATVTVTVNSDTLGNPIADDIVRSTDEDVNLTAFLNATDADGSITNYEILTNPAHGAAILSSASSGEFIYTPNPDFSGTDSFTYRATDNDQKQSAQATVLITVNPINDLPVIDKIHSDIYNAIPAANDITFQGSLSATDVDSNTLTFSIAEQPKNGLAVVDPATGVFEYSSSITRRGEEQFVISVSDGEPDGIVSQTITVCVFIPGEDCSNITKPSLISPKHNSVDHPTTVTFEWKGSEYKNQNDQSSTKKIDYQLVYCTTSTFDQCAPIDIQTEVMDNTTADAAFAVSIGGGTGLFLLGLVSLSSRRRTYALILFMLLAASILNACNSGAKNASDGVKPLGTAVLEGNKIVYNAEGLTADTTYFWKVIAIDSETQKTAESGIFSFSTAP